MRKMTSKDDHINNPAPRTFRFLRWFCPDHLYEEIEGDLIQKFEKDEKLFGEGKAKRRLMWNTIRFFRPGIILRNKFSFDTNPFHMWLQQLKFSARVLMKDRFFSALNVVGLALGISVSIILLLILQSDLTYDQHYAKHERIYRLGSHYQITGVDEYVGLTARELGPILQDQFREIESFTRLDQWSNTLVKATDGADGKAFYETKISQTDSTYFHLFDHSFISGDPHTAMTDTKSVVLTRSTAKKYFGDVDPLGKTLDIKGKLWTVTAVISDLPDNTHYKFDILLSGLPEIRETWDATMKDGKPISEVFWNPDVVTFLLLPEDYNPQDFYSKFPKIYDLYFKESGETVGGKNTPILEKIANIHLYSDLQDNQPQGNLMYLRTFTGIGVLIALLACINYMNLSTAKAVSRATEIAVKKIMGSSRRMLVLSTITESLLLSLISLLLAVGIVYALLNTTSFNQLIGKQLSPNFFSNPMLCYGSVLITLVIGYFSGLYPAYYLTSIPAITALKGVFKNRKSSHVTRRLLITVQFCVSFFVVICTLFMSKQINFVLNQSLGFDKDNLLVVPLRDSTAFKNQEILKNELLKDPRITSVTAAADVMGMGVGGGIMFGEGSGGEMVQHGGILALFVGDDYLKTMGLTLLQGRDFQPGPKADVDGTYILNESAVKLMGWNENPLGKKMTFWGGHNPGQVIGVVNDFNVNALYQGIDPMVIVKGHWDKGYLQIRLTGADLPGVIQHVQEKWSQHDASPFEYFFLDQRFNEQYKEDREQNQLLRVLSFICILISLLGLIGLSAFNATQRTKEIGVRKILGANVPDIILLLSKNTLGLVLLSSLLMIPVSWWAVTSWLETFVYRAPIDYLVYVIVTLFALGLVGITISFQSFKTARANPVESLKYE